MTLEIIIATVCCLLLLYFPGYPLWLWWMGKNRRPPFSFQMRENPFGKISILLAAHNEAKYLSAKLDNLLNLQTGGRAMEIVVVLDGCSDGSEDIMNVWNHHSHIKCLVLPDRQGKAHAINQGVGLASGSVLVMCDASQQLPSDALLHLLTHFDNPEIGLVSGCLETHPQLRTGWSLFRKYTNWLRVLESGAGWLVGAYGPLYAVRRSLFQPLPEDGILDDMFLPLEVAIEGQRAIFEPRAKVYDQRNFMGVPLFRRGRRIVCGLFQFVPLVWRARISLPFKVMFFMHKLYRLLLLPIAVVGVICLFFYQEEVALWMTLLGLVGFLFVANIRHGMLQMIATTCSLLAWPFLKSDVLWKK